MTRDCQQTFRFVRRRSRRLIDHLRSTLRNIEKCDNQMVKQSLQIETISDEQAAKTIQEQAGHVGALVTFCRQYLEQFVTPYESKENDLLQKELSNVIRKSREQLGIQAAIFENTLILRIPHPVSRYSKKASESTYIPEIRDAICEAKWKAEEACSLDLFSKNVFISFWHFYPPESCESRNRVPAYPDNDNYLVKSIIDLLSSVFGFYDRGDTAHLFYGTQITSDFPSMTYIFLQTRDSEMKNFITFEEVKKFLFDAGLFQVSQAEKTRKSPTIN